MPDLKDGKKGLALIIAKRIPKKESDGEESDEGLKAATEELMAAFKSESSEELQDSLESFIEMKISKGPR